LINEGKLQAEVDQQASFLIRSFIKVIVQIKERENIVSLYKSGISMRRISSLTNHSFGKIRRFLIRNGVHTVKHKKINNGMTECISCKKTLSLENFRRLDQGQYYCQSCVRKKSHRNQIGKYGCSELEYEKLLKKQNGVCAICGSENGHYSKYGLKCKLAVDHDHKTGNIRGLLCNLCNRGLGLFKDSISSLQNAAHYLNEASCWMKKPIK
jgi:hypothetical protein